MHNFPEDKLIVCNKIHTLKEAKEIIKLCIDNEVPIEPSIINRLVNENYPRFIMNTNISHTSCDPMKYSIVSIEEFKNFIQGKGDEKKINSPFEEKLELSYDYTATVTKEKIVVGCTSFSHERIAELYALSLKAQKAKR